MWEFHQLASVIGVPKMNRICMSSEKCGIQLEEHFIADMHFNKINNE